MLRTARICRYPKSLNSRVGFLMFLIFIQIIRIGNGFTGILNHQIHMDTKKPVGTPIAFIPNEGIPAGASTSSSHELRHVTRCQDHVIGRVSTTTPIVERIQNWPVKSKWSACFQVAEQYPFLLRKSTFNKLSPFWFPQDRFCEHTSQEPHNHINSFSELACTKLSILWR